MDVFALAAKITLDTNAYETQLEGASQRTSSFGDKIKGFLSSAAKFGAAAISTATAAVTAFGASSVKTGMEFDSSMSQVAATMGTTVDQIQDLRDFAMDMGSKTAFSAVQAADALNYMALAGYDADEAMAALPNVLNLAAAGSIELAAASDMVTDAQSALGLSMEESAQLVDKMAMASSKSNTSVAQLGEAILTVGGTAKNLSGGTTELATALGILADNGIKGAEGGTTLRNVILSLAAPTDIAAGTMEELGLKVFDAEGNMRPLNETFADLDAILSTMSQGKQTQVLSTIFNKVDLKGVNALLANTGTRFDELSGYIDNATGSAEKMAAVQLDNLEGDITLFKSAMEGAQIVLSDQLTPALRAFVQFGASAVSTVSEAFQEGGLTGAMDALGTILSDGLNMVIGKLPDMAEAGMQLLGSLGQGLLDNLPVISDAAVEILVMLVDGIAEGLPKLADGAVEIVTQLANSIGEALPKLIPKAVEAVLEFAQNLTSPESINSIRDASVNLIDGLVTGLGDAVPILVEYAPEIIKNLLAAMVPDIPRILEIGEKVITELGNALIVALKGLPDRLKAAGEVISEGLKGVFGEEAIDGILESISSAWDSVTTFFADTWETIKTGAETAWGAITGFFLSAWEIISPVWNAAVEFFSNIWEEIKSTFLPVAEDLGGFFNDAWNAVQEIWEIAGAFFSGIWEEIQGIFSVVAVVLGAFFSDAWNSTQDTWNVAVEFFSGVWNGITSVFEVVSTWFGGIFREAWTAITRAFSNVGSFFSGVWGTIKSGFQSLVRSATQWGRDLIDNFVGGIKEFAGKVSAAVSGVASTVRDFLGFSEPEKGPLSNFHTYAPDMMQLFAKGINDNASLLETAFNKSLDFDAALPSLSYGYDIPVSEYAQKAGGHSTGVAGSGVIVNQNIYAAEQSPVELAANTRAAFQRARWAIT